MNATKIVSVNDRNVINRSDRSLFARLLIIREKRGVLLNKLLQYSLGPVVWSLATPNGTVFKTVKSKLLTSLENKINLVDQLPPNTPRIYDRMCILQQLLNGLETFGEVSEFVLRRITSNDSTSSSLPISIGPNQTSLVSERDVQQLVPYE